MKFRTILLSALGFVSLCFWRDAFSQIEAKDADAAIAAQATPYVLRLEMPVSFQLTRSRLLGPGAATVTETYREVWTLMIRSGHLMDLSSPRAEVPVFAATSLKHQNRNVPRSLVIGESDFARLVGVIPPEEDNDEPQPISRPLTLLLGKTAKSGSDIKLGWRDEEQFAIHIELGTTQLF